MKRQKAWIGIFLLFLLGSGCSVSNVDTSFRAMRTAVLAGKIKDALTSYEIQAQEAEKDAASSLFSQYYWGVAIVAYMQAASAANFSGQLQKAVIYGEKALEIARRTQAPAYNRADPVLDYPPLPELSAIRTLLGIYRSVRAFDKELALIETGFTLAREVRDINRRDEGEGILSAALGREFLRQRDYEKAIDALSNAVYSRKSFTAGVRRFRRTLEASESSLVGLLIDLGDAYRSAGRLDEALQHYQEAFEYVKEGRARYTAEYSLYAGIGQVNLQQRNFSQALENFQKALALAEAQRRTSAVSSASRRIGDILRRSGKPAEAVPYYQRAIQQIESTRSLLESEEYRQSFFEGQLRPYVSMMTALLSAGKQEEAFNYSERARSRGFLDVLGSKVELSRVKSGLLEEERALQERIAAIKARLSGEEEGETDRSVLRKQLAEAEGAYSAFLARVRKQDKEQVSLMSVEPLTLKEVQGFLDPGTTLIEYFVSGPNTFVWVVEKDKLQFVAVELPREELAGLVKDLRDSVFTLGEKNKFDEASALLYKQLIEPLLTHITGKELIIVPHDVLHYLPFHALVGSDGHYLIEKYPVYYLSSASLLQFVKEKRKAGGEKVLAFGNPDLGDPEKNLEYAELEAQEVKAVYPESSVFLKQEASEEKSKSLSPTHDILHFATHAQLNEDDPLSSAVLLANEGKEDGRLEVREIFGMDLKANLVVLSGCDTGLGKLSTGDELVGLTRAFIYAGTPSVVASLWSVDDSSTAHLMSSFYRNLKRMSKVEALRQAQLELIRGDGRSDLLARRGVGGIGKLGETPEPQSSSQNLISISTSHPYFWAPFILVGDGK
jgi:CHAT domain-containing protein/predicted negative regulator of RcsB-dependent stress response